MTRLHKGLIAFPGSVVISSFLFFFLLAGAMEPSREASVLQEGSIRISKFPDEPVRKEEVFTTSEVPQVESMDAIDTPMDTALDQPEMDLDMPSLDLDIAAEMAGTVPVAGLESLSGLNAMGAPSGGALTLGQVDEMPRALYTPQPLYPSSERAKGEEREVTVRIWMRKDGSVSRALPMNETPETAPFHKAAIQAVLQWRFMPAKKEGKAVPCVADQPISFSLNR